MRHFENLLQKKSEIQEKNTPVEDELVQMPLHFLELSGNWKAGNYFVSAREKNLIQMKLLWKMLLLYLKPKMLVTRNYPEI